MAAAKDVFQRKEANRALLGQHATLLDLLELPQVMETCVRNGNYEEVRHRARTITVRDERSLLCSLLPCTFSLASCMFLNPPSGWVCLCHVVMSRSSPHNHQPLCMILHVLNLLPKITPNESV